MEQNTDNRYNQPSTDNVHQQPPQEDNQPTLETQEEETTETTYSSSIIDYWYLPHKDSRTFNQNIKIRNS